MTRKGSSQVAIPNELYEILVDMKRKREFGFTSASGIATVAVREFLKEYGKLTPGIQLPLSISRNLEIYCTKEGKSIDEALTEILLPPLKEELRRRGHI